MSMRRPCPPPTPAEAASPLIAPDLAAAPDGPPLLAVRRQDAALRHTATHRHARGQLFGAYRGC